MRSDLLLLFLALSFSGSVVSSPDARPMSVEDFVQTKNVIEAAISPDAKHVAYVVAEPDLEESTWSAHIWLVNTADQSTRRFTNAGTWNNRPSWSSDSQTLVYMTDQFGGNQAVHASLDSGEPKSLSSVEGGIGAFSLSPDGSYLAFLKREPQSEEIVERRKQKVDVHIEDESFPRQGLYLQDMQTGEVSRLWSAPDQTVAAFDWSPNGEEIVMQINSIPGTMGLFFGSDLGVASVRDKKFRHLVQREGMDAGPQWSPDGSKVAFMSHNGIKDWIGAIHINVVDADGGTPKNISPQFRERDYNAEYFWANDSRSVNLLVPRGVETHLFSIDVATTKETQITSGMRVYGQFSVAADGDRVAFLRSGTAEPSEVFVGTLSDMEPRRLTQINPAHEDLDLYASEIVRWKSFDGREIEGLLIRPHANGPAPLITIIHGGPSIPMTAGFAPQGGAGGWPQFDAPIQVLAGQGFAVFLPNFRGTGAYGREFFLANLEDWGGGDLQDVLLGIDHLVDQGVVDPDRLGIQGWSYGGTLTSYAITQDHRFKAAIVGAGITDHFSAYGTMDIPPFIERMMGGPPWEAHETFRKCSSMSWVHQTQTPALLIYGENDARVPVSQGREFYRGLQRIGVESQLVVYPRSGHSIFEPRLQRDYHQRIVKWWDKWIPDRS